MATVMTGAELIGQLVGRYGVEGTLRNEQGATIHTINEVQPAHDWEANGDIRMLMGVHASTNNYLYEYGIFTPPAPTSGFSNPSLIVSDGYEAAVAAAAAPLTKVEIDTWGTFGGVTDWPTDVVNMSGRDGAGLYRHTDGAWWISSGGYYGASGNEGPTLGKWDNGVRSGFYKAVDNYVTPPEPLWH